MRAAFQLKTTLPNLYPLARDIMQIYRVHICKLSSSMLQFCSLCQFTVSEALSGKYGMRLAHEQEHDDFVAHAQTGG